MHDPLFLVALSVPAALSVVFSLYGQILYRRESAALHRIERAPLRTPLPVIIPARNEGARIEATLKALLRDPAEKMSIVVYDDQSTDDTVEVVERVAASDKRVTLVRGVVDDETGFGKPKALHRAVSHIDKDAHRILFLDADVLVEPGTIGGMVRILESTKAGALSGSPRLITESAVEDMVVPAMVALVGARHRPSRVNDLGYPDAFLNGQIILVDKHAFDEIGGFGSVKDTVLEDVALGVRMKRHRQAIRLADLRPHVATRMYKSFSEIRAGFGKNMVPLLGGVLTTASYAALGLLVGTVPLVSVVVAAVTTPLALVAIVPLMVLNVVLVARARRNIGGRAWPALVIPFTQIIVAMILFEGVVKALTGGQIEWRGRRYRAARTLPESIHISANRMQDLDAWLDERRTNPPIAATPPSSSTTERDAVAEPHPPN